MSAEVSTLSEGFLTERTLERAKPCVLPEVVPQVATFLEHASTVRILAFEVEFDSLGLWVLYADCLMPLFRDAFKGLMFVSS